MRDLLYDYSSNISISPTLCELKKATDRSLMVGDLTTVFNTLRTATDIVRHRNINDWNKTGVSTCILLYYSFIPILMLFLVIFEDDKSSNFLQVIVLL